MIKKYLVGIVIVLMGLMIYGLIEGTITGNLVKEKDEKIVINFPKSADFPNPEQGGVVFEFSFPAASFKVGNKTADILMFLDSEVIPGLKVGYDTKEKKVKAGLPLLSFGEVEVIDGNPHKLMYTFDRANKRQILYLDGRLVAEGEFTGEKSTDGITSFIVYQKWTYIESPIGIKVRFE